MTILISAIVFACAVAIKGGWLGTIFTNWNRLVKRVEATLRATLADIKIAWSTRAYGDLVKLIFALPFRAFAKWFLDGSVISLFIVFIYVAMSQPSLTVAALFALSWCLIWSSMGEEAGAAGDYAGWWGRYKDAGFKRDYGIKKGIQYGCFTGAGMAMSIGSWCPWIAAATFPICYFLGSSILLYTSKGKDRGWTYAEPIWGAAIGIGYGLAINGFMPI